MAGVGESFLLELAVELVVNAMLGFHIIKDARNYAAEATNFKTRMEVQMAIWHAIGDKLSNEEIKNRIRKRELETHYKIDKKLYRLLYKYLQRNCGGDKKNKRHA
jgi:hypothetical protein